MDIADILANILSEINRMRSLILTLSCGENYYDCEDPSLFSDICLSKDRICELKKYLQTLKDEDGNMLTQHKLEV